jgi:tetratricopeptide (TPR) repeat protein
MRKKNKGMDFAGRLKIKALLFTIILPLTVLFFSGCSRNHVKLAEDLTKTKKYEDALEHYFKALKSNPDRIDLKINIDRLLKDAAAHYFHLGKKTRRNET